MNGKPICEECGEECDEGMDICDDCAEMFEDDDYEGEE